MDNETLFYVLGTAAAVSAVVVSFAGLKLKNFPGRATPLVVLWFVVLVGGATTFVVRYSQEHEEHRAAELEHAGHEVEEEETVGPYEDGTEGQERGDTNEEPGEGGNGGGEAEGGGEAGGGAATGQGSTLQLAADKTDIAFDKTSLKAQAGEVTIEFDNPSSIPHDVAILEDGETIAKTEIISEAEESVSADLESGTYTFICTVPGHAQAGMEGTLTVE